MGTCMTTTTIASKVMKKGFEFYSTYGWHPLAVEAAIANIRYWKKNKEKIFRNVTALSQCFTDRLSQMKFKNGATLRIFRAGYWYRSQRFKVCLTHSAKKHGKGTAVHYPGKDTHFFSAIDHETSNSRTRIGHIGELFIM